MRTIEGLTIGRIVHYAPYTSPGPEKADERPAIVVHVWNQDTGCANLQVFTDGTNDGEPDGTKHVTSVLFSETPTPGFWHWPEKA